jgi:hypothetical protein
VTAVTFSQSGTLFLIPRSPGAIDHCVVGALLAGGPVVEKVVWAFDA